MNRVRAVRACDRNDHHVSKIEFIVPQLNTIVNAIRIFVNDMVIVIHIVSMFGTVLFTNT